TGGTTRTAPTGVGTLTPAPEPPPVGLPPMGTVLWSEDFSSPAGMNRLIKHISIGDNVVNGAAMQTFNGDHGHNCGGPTTGRSLVENYEVSTHFWYCAPGGDAAKGHFMTGINTEGYVIMAFAPAADNGTTARVFPATANQICWDQNITELGARKWTQLIVVNASRYAANGNRIDYVNPEFNDNGGTGSRAAVRLAGDDFLLNNLRNTAHFFNGQTKTYSDWNGLHNITDKATRYTICVRDNGNGTVTRTQARPGGVVAVSTGPGRFPAGPRVFILEDDSYNPMKAFQDGQQQVVTDPFTWHWDNIRVSSS
ncbi:MAG: hypothetical protein Q7V62_04770, partial [Actinomycetota bacterium]|nr:hypothetical protein [Actinomycetota bacterium]